jgi:hypothetical protein
MKLTFLGTRGEIDIRTARHRRHSTLFVTQGRTRVMIDCGLDWLEALHGLSRALRQSCSRMPTSITRGASRTARHARYSHREKHGRLSDAFRSLSAAWCTIAKNSRSAESSNSR